MKVKTVYRKIVPAAGLSPVTRPADEIPHLLTTTYVSGLAATVAAGGAKPPAFPVVVRDAIFELKSRITPALVLDTWLFAIGLRRPDLRTAHRVLGQVRMYSSVVDNVRTHLAAAGWATTSLAGQIITLVISDLAMRVAARGQTLGFDPYWVATAYQNQYFPTDPRVDDLVADSLESLLLDSLSPLIAVGNKSLAIATSVLGPQYKIVVGDSTVDPGDLMAIGSAIDVAAEACSKRLTLAATVADKADRAFKIEISRGMSNLLDETFPTSSSRVDESLASALDGCANLLSDDFAKHAFSGTSDREALAELLKAQFNGKRYWDILHPRLRRYALVSAEEYVKDFSAIAFRDDMVNSPDMPQAAACVMVWRGLEGQGAATESTLVKTNDVGPIGAGATGAYGTAASVTGGSIYGIERTKLGSLAVGLEISRYIEALDGAFEGSTLKEPIFFGLKQTGFLTAENSTSKGPMQTGSGAIVTPFTTETRMLACCLADEVKYVAPMGSARPGSLDVGMLRYHVNRPRIVRLALRHSSAAGKFGLERMGAEGVYVFSDPRGVVFSTISDRRDNVQTSVEVANAHEIAGQVGGRGVWVAWPSWITGSAKRSLFGMLDNLAGFSSTLDVNYPTVDATQVSFKLGLTAEVIKLDVKTDVYKLKASTLLAYGEFIPDMQGILSTRDAGKRAFGGILLGLLTYAAGKKKNAAKLDDLLGSGFDAGATLGWQELTEAEDQLRVLQNSLVADMRDPGFKRRMVDEFNQAVVEYNSTAPTKPLVMVPITGKAGLKVAMAHVELAHNALKMGGLAPHSALMAEGIDTASKDSRIKQNVRELANSIVNISQGA